MKQVLPKTDKNVVAILSGGLDSTIMTHYLVKTYGNDKVYALSFDYGQKQRRELEMARMTCSTLNVIHQVLDLSVLGNIARKTSANIGGTEVAMPTIKDVLGDPQPVTYVPFRNMILCSIAFSFAEAHNASHIFTGLQSRDLYGYWDTSPEFVGAMNAVAMKNRQHQIQLVSPFVDISKTEEIKLAMEMHIEGWLKYTLSCYNPDSEGRSCGTCPTCAERIKAFMDCGIKDPIPYQKEIKWPI